MALASPFCSVAALNGSVQTVTFTGPVTQQQVTFSLYLPPGYSAGTSHFPVIYHLHGLGGMHHSPQTNLVPANHEVAVNNGTIEPCIIVFPDAYRNSFWADSINSTKPAETNVKQEIIPFVDANYRTVATRSRRAIQGFSMGGFGAAKFATKFPETFAACVIYDGAMLTWPQMQQRHPTEATEIFDNKAAVFNLYSPWYWLTQNVITLRATMPFDSIVAALTGENRAWRDAVLGQAVALTYVETGLTHSLGPLLDAQGSNSWAFITRAFAAASNDSSGLRLRLNRLGDHAELNWPSEPGQTFQVEHRTNLNATWQPLVTNIAAIELEARFVHSNALAAPAGYYRLLRHGTSPLPANFNWSGTNFTYADAQRSFTGILLKPPGEGPFPAVIIAHGAGSTLSGYALTKAREISAWGMVCMAPTLTHVAGGETDPANMGHCPDNIARALTCAEVLGHLTFVDSNRLTIFGHSMGAFAAIGQTAALSNRIRAASITSGGVIPDTAPGGSSNASPTVSEANPVRVPFLMIHCDGDPRRACVALPNVADDSEFKRGTQPTHCCVLELDSEPQQLAQHSQRCEREHARAHEHTRLVSSARRAAVIPVISPLENDFFLLEYGPGPWIVKLSTMLPPDAKVILLVEDNEDDVFLLENALAMAEVKSRLEVVRDGQEALHYLSGTAQFADRERFPFPALVFLDLKLPYRSGLDVLSWMRQETNLPATIVVALTSSDEPADLKTAYGLGVTTYLVKPPTAPMICDIVTAFKLDWLRNNASQIQNK